MKFRVFQKSVWISIAAGAFAAGAFAQLPEPPPLPGLDIRITTGRPPSPRYEHRPARPGPDYVWVGGFWGDEAGHWNWVPGRWERPAEPGAYWIAPRYVHSQGAYVYEPGHWSNQTLIAGEDVRAHRAWKHHEREHDRELDREHHHNRDYDREHEREH